MYAIVSKAQHMVTKLHDCLPRGMLATITGPASQQQVTSQSSISAGFQGMQSCVLPTCSTSKNIQRRPTP